MKRVHLRVALLALVGLLAGAGPAAAQLLPPVGLPVPDLTRGAVPAVDRDLRSSVRGTLVDVRRLAVRELLRRHPRELERDPRGAPIVRSVILALSPGEGALRDAIAQGFTIQRDEALDALGERVVTLLAPTRFTTRRALEWLRRNDPGGRYDFSHLYTQSGEVGAGAAGNAASSSGIVGPRSSAPRIGMVDGGLLLGHPALRDASMETLGCSGRNVPSAHGTAVASLLVGHASGFDGAAPGLPLTAIDVWCGDEAPGGRIDDIVRAMAQLAARPVAVMNLSLVGPPNVVLQGVVARVVAKDIVVVAAAGNDGPRARPLYPAAYPGVVAVTAVDASNRALIEAARGAHVRFAAPGADMIAAALSPDYAPVRGTSFASPLVAGLVAERIARGATSTQAIALLAGEARDLGKKGRDDTYGDGLVGTSLRREPVQTARQAR